MRDLPFLLRLHAFPPLARFSRTPRKPYLPLEVRYLIRPSEEVFLYLSNNSDNKTWGDDLSIMPAEGIYSYLTNDYVFLGMLCRRGLACHYLPLYEARWRPPYEYPAQENIALPKTKQDPIFILCILWLPILILLGFCLLLAERSGEWFGLTR